MYFLVLIMGFLFQLFNRRILFYMFTLILVVMGCLRYGIGLDFFAYEYLYERLQPSPILEYRFGADQQEIGFRVLGSFLKSIGFTYQMYIMVFAIITVVFIAKICKKYSQNPTLSLLIFFSFYYLTWTFNGIRQGIVIAIGLYYLLECIEKKQFKKFLVIVVLLSLMHSSALVLILFYFVAKVQFKKKQLIGLSIASIILSLVPVGAIVSKLTWLPFYYRILPYLKTEMALNIPDIQGLGRIAFLVIVFVFYDVYSKHSEIYRKIINMYIFSMILYFVLQFSELTAARLAIYGNFLIFLILANALYLFKFRVNRLVYIYFIFALCSVYLYKETGEINKSVSSEKTIAPYVTIFNKDDFYFTSRYYNLHDY